MLKNEIRDTRAVIQLKTDLEIAAEAEVKPIWEIAEQLGIDREELRPYGNHIAKVPLNVISKFDKNENGKLILVTAITATPAGEGKTVTSIGLMQGLSKIGKNVVGALREPSLGPTFGVKGGATGGGFSQVYPMWDIDLHFTGDIHAVSAAHNLLSAILENSILKGNPNQIDPSNIVLKKTMDMNCRELRKIVVGLGGRNLGGITHESGFLITSASEISAILCLATDRENLRERLSKMVVAYTYDGKAVTAGDLGCVGAMMVLLKDAIEPNLVQTLEGQPVFIHGFPFANIAHGANSIIATKAALKMGDYVVTEAGFAADLGAEKFMDIVCRQAGFAPDCTVIVASIRALMMHGGANIKDESTHTTEALIKGFANLDKHLENLQGYGIPVVVAINRFDFDTDEQIAYLRKHCEEKGASVAESTVYANGGEGAEELARTVVETIENKKADFHVLYDLDSSVEDKIQIIAKKIYGADRAVFATTATRAIKDIVNNGYGKLPVCIAKTQLSISDDPSKKGAPRDWDLVVKEVFLSAGAGFIVPVCGTMTLMPGLSSEPAAMRMDLLPDGRIVGLK